MARQLTNFIDSYLEYARDGFVPDRFHLWSGLSILAGAVERKISLKQDLIHYVPNIYVMLVSHPKGGKSTAIIRAADLVEEMKQRNPIFRILPNQMTEPAFIDLMKIVDRIPSPTNPNQLISQSAGYFYASEASSSALKDPEGFIVAAFTDFWDCPKWFRKKLKTERDSVEIENACLNMLAGTTFHFLKSLINEQSVLGGFASRLIYVVSPARKARAGKWESRAGDLDLQMKEKLISDLLHINTLMGPMKPTKGWIDRYEVFEPKFDEYLMGLKSERLEGIMARKDTNLIKVSMLLSLAESDSLIVNESHFERAEELVEDVYRDNPSVVAAAAMADKTSQSGVNQAIGQILKKNGGVLHMKTLKNLVLQNGNQVSDIVTTIEFMISSGFLGYDTSGLVSLIGDPDRNL